MCPYFSVLDPVLIECMIFLSPFLDVTRCLCQQFVSLHSQALSVWNLPRQSANVETFAEAYLNFLISAFFLPRQLNDDDDVFQTNSNLFSWGRSFTILSTYFCILFPHFCSLISVSKKLDIERILTLPYSHKWQKFNKINERKSQGCQSVGTEYVAEQINSLTL